MNRKALYFFTTAVSLFILTGCGGSSSEELLPDAGDVPSEVPASTVTPTPQTTPGATPGATPTPGPSPIPDNSPAPSPVLPTPSLAPTPVPIATPAPANINLAFARDTTQSSTDFDGESARAVDGNTSGVFQEASTTHTQVEREPWWQVDLGSIENISHVNLFNRTDICCSGRLEDFFVFVSDSEFAFSGLTDIAAQSGVSSYHYESAVDQSVSIDIDRSGRYVRVQLVGDAKPLSLAEVEVISAGGVAAPVPTPVVTPEVTPVVTPVATPEATPIPSPSPAETPATTPTPAPTPTPAQTPDPIATPSPTLAPSPTPVSPEPEASYTLGVELYGSFCAGCHESFENTTKPNRSRLSLISAISVIPQMQFLQFSDVELDSLVIALSGNSEPLSCDVATLPPRLSRLTPAQYDNTIKTFIPDVGDSPSEGFVASLSTGRFSNDTAVLSMSAPHVNQLIDVSDGLAELLATRPETLAACMGGPAGGEAVTAFGECNFEGYAVPLEIGEYDRLELQALGIANDTVSSLQLPEGYRVTLYANSLSGDTLELTSSDACLIDDNFDNTVGGIRVLGSVQTDDPLCTDSFVAELLTRAFRRPAEDEEVLRFRDYYDIAAAEFTEEIARKLLIQRVLLSPEFLFRTEIGADDGVLDNYELASAVSYLISDGPPDQALYAAAASGTLSDPDVLLAQGERLLSQRTTGAGVESFFRENLNYDQVQGVDKDEDVFPGFDGAVAQAMASETQEFIAHVLWDDDARLSTLLTARYSLLNENLEDVYGVSGLGADFERVELGAERGGLLTQPSLLARFATNEESDIVHRGQYIAEEILCRIIPDPPPGVGDSVVDIDITNPITQRQVIEQHSSDPLCASCHVIFDDFGTVLESFDAIGAYREQLPAFTFSGSDFDNLLPVDPVVDILNLGPVNAPADLIDLMADSNEALVCFAERLTQYSLGGESDVTQCEQESLVEQLEASDGDMRAAILHLITSPKFQQRTPRGQ